MLFALIRKWDYNYFQDPLTSPNVTITTTSATSMTVEWENIRADVDGWRIRVLDVKKNEWIEVYNLK